MENSEISEIFTFLNKSISLPLSFCLGKFFVFFASKLQLLSKFQVKKIFFQGFKVSILSIWQIMFSQNVLFHAQVFYFIEKSRSALETCSFISQYLMKFEICNVMMSISTERGSFYIYVYLIINH